jgi:hypothetical protein
MPGKASSQLPGSKRVVADRLAVGAMAEKLIDAGAD